MISKCLFYTQECIKMQHITKHSKIAHIFILQKDFRKHAGSFHFIFLFLNNYAATFSFGVAAIFLYSWINPA